jgi:hypothetical protein
MVDADKKAVMSGQAGDSMRMFGAPACSRLLGGQSAHKPGCPFIKCSFVHESEIGAEP